MAVTGVNNYSNIYTNAYTGNIRKNNAKETTEKQVVEQTEDVKTGTTRKTAADELSYLSKKFDSDAVWIRYQVLKVEVANHQQYVEMICRLFEVYTFLPFIPIHQ